MAPYHGRYFRQWMFILALAAMVLSVAMSFISDEGAIWAGAGRLSILFVLGVAWWSNESQIDL